MPEERTTSSTGGQKGVKTERFDLIPVGPLLELARHYGYGAEKYATHQWRQGYEWSKSYSAIMRHLAAFWSGLDYDVCSNEPDNCQHEDANGQPFSTGRPDTCYNHTGSHHMAAVAWHSFLLLEFKDQHPGHDDRYVLPREPNPYGIRTAEGTLILDPTWFSMSDVMRGMVQFGFKQASECGVLVRYEGGDWREVKH